MATRRRTPIQGRLITRKRIKQFKKGQRKAVKRILKRKKQVLKRIRTPPGVRRRR